MLAERRFKFLSAQIHSAWLDPQVPTEFCSTKLSIELAFNCFRRSRMIDSILSP